jgi:hypothetical protein
MKPQSIPSNPSVPDKAYYPASELQTVRRYNRDSYFAEFGEQAPPFDSSRPPKFWFDSTALDNHEPDERLAYTKLVYDVFVPFDLKASEAATVNLPGVYQYPAYQVEPTPAVVLSVVNSPETPINARHLSSKEDAEAIVSELGTAYSESNLTDGPYSVDWRGETRRFYQVRFKNNLLNVGQLLILKNAGGVGAPGAWNLDGDEPTWTPALQETGENDPRPEVPVPVRRLASVERLSVNPFGVTVYRMDRESPYNPKPVVAVGGSGGGLTAGQEALLNEINQNVWKVLKLMVGG